MESKHSSAAGQPTSIDKALEVCEVLSGAPRGLSVSELARAVKQPASTVHRLLGVLKRRGYVRQDEETHRYGLTLRLLDLSFRALGRSELRLHAYPLMREYAIRTGDRGFIAIPATGEVSYIWSTGPDEVAMHTVYGREMPAHCAIYFSSRQARRLSCLKLNAREDVDRADTRLVRLGSEARAAGRQRLTCTCAPVRDYTGQEVARVGLFAHAEDDRPLYTEHHRSAWDLARRISLRLGHVPTSMLEESA
jgi:DNA-binding IclR family transcriptional regulator